jgi:nitrogen fixation protein FixH
MAPRNNDTTAPTDGKPLSGWHVLAILLTAFVVTLLANGALIYLATDAESDFRALIDMFC